MPAGTLCAEIGKHHKSIGWSVLFSPKRIFGSVRRPSPTAARIWRSSKILCSGRLCNEFNRHGWRNPPCTETWAMNCEEPKRLCLRAPAAGVISVSKSAEPLGHAIRELVRLMDEPPAMDAVFANA